MNPQCECGCGKATRISPRTVKAKGWIKGKPRRFLPGHSSRRPIEARCLYVVNETTGCWEWRGTIARNGYGLIWIGNNYYGAHRYMYETANGKLPNSLQLDHLCRNRKCVNPSHLEPVSAAVNVQRGCLAKITMEQAREIRELYGSGILQRELASMFGLTRPTISALVNNHTWREDDTGGTA